jgi:para-nitrobenzyl esterase
MERRFVYEKGIAETVTTGGRVRGYIEDGVTVFKGIPYAHAKRFHKPEPAAFEKVFDATSYGFVCPLLTNDRPNGELLCPHRYWPQDEDCLNLNVWTPACDDARRPVMVWLHGGGYFGGSSIEQQAYEGGTMAHEGDAVVVSINHRLNILGYFDVSDFGPEYENSGNAGMEDIICALRWVRDNVASFGGDPSNVTLFGQSGGGAKITTLLQMPEADGLFRRGINMSGVIGSLLTDDEGSEAEIAEAVMKDLGLRGIGELETVDYYLFAKSYNRLAPIFAKAGKPIGGNPHRNAQYSGDPVKCGFRKESAGVDMLIGSVFGEFLSFNPTSYDKRVLSNKDGENIVRAAYGEEGASAVLPLFGRAYPERNPVDLMTIDTIFRPGIQAYVAERAAVCPGHTFSYLFNLDMPVDGGRTPWHCADIPYVFHNTGMCLYTQESGVTERIENQIFQSVMAFARNGDPSNGYIPEWPACTPETENTMVIGKNSAQVRPDFDIELIRAVLKYAPKAAFGNIQH